jgi:hypothetical protein
MIVDLRTIPEGSRRFQFVLEQDWWPSDAQRDQVLGIDSPVQVNLEIYRWRVARWAPGCVRQMP